MKNVPKLRFKDDNGRDFPAWITEFLLSLSENGFSNGVFNDPSKVGSGYKLVNVSDMYIESTIDERNLTLVNIDYSEFVKNKVEKGDVFFTRSSLVKEGIACSNVYLGESQDITFDGHLVRMRPKKNLINSVFLNYLLKTKEVRKQLVARGKTATMTTIGQSDIATVNIIFPSANKEQTKIADFLTAIDDRISQLSQKCDGLAQYKKGLMQKIFSQELRFKDEKGRAFPAWEEATIGERVNEKTIKYKPDDQKLALKCIELEHLSQNNGQLLGYSNTKNIKSIKNKFDEGDVLFGKLRPYLRKFLKAPFSGVCSTEIWVLKGKGVSNDYLYQFVQTEEFIALANISSGSKMPRADWEIIASTLAFFPCNKEQAKIAGFLSAVDEKISQAQAQRDALKQYKQGLLQQMFV